jgi:hypothetical protein
MWMSNSFQASVNKVMDLNPNNFASSHCHWLHLLIVFIILDFTSISCRGLVWWHYLIVNCRVVLSLLV